MITDVDIQQPPPEFSPVSVTFQLETAEELGQFMALMSHRWVVEGVPALQLPEMHQKVAEACRRIQQPIHKSQYHAILTTTLRRFAG